MAASKDTVYIDVEDEITAVIDKMLNSKHKIIAIVLPKRATVFQSVVNMKILKKAAASAKKSLVLITSDQNSISIAGTVGLHVAKTPASKPYLPSVKRPYAGLKVTNWEDKQQLDNEGIEETKDTEKTGSSKEAEEDAFHINLENEEDTEQSVDKTDKKTKKVLRIPDFSSFRIKLTLSVLLVAGLVTAWVFGFVILPKATVTIQTDVKTSSVVTTITARLGDVKLDLEKNIIPAQRVQAEKIDFVTVAATGTKNVGEKATGTMTLTNCIDDSKKKVIPAGTTFSSNSFTFTTDQQITLAIAIYQGPSCKSADFPSLGAQKTVAVSAAQPGPEYNLSAKSYASSISGIQAFGSSMSGGTTKNITVISDGDIQKATQQLTGKSKQDATAELTKQLEDKGLRAIQETLSEGTPEVVADPAVGVEAKETKVTRTITYNLTGLFNDDISKILDNEVNKNMGETKQNIRDNGLADIAFQVVKPATAEDQSIAIQTIATLGPDIDVEALKQDIAGKKRGEIEHKIESIDGVRSVKVEYSPAWITTTPNNAEKIVIVLNENNENR